MLFGYVPVYGQITIGVPTSLGFIEGRESLNAVRLAMEEINAAGGVRVGERNMELKVEYIDLRDAVPGEQIPGILSRLETFITEKKINAIVVGPFRSEVLLAGLDTIASHRVPFLGTIAMTPVIEDKVMRDSRYKYIFRVGIDSKYLVDYLIQHMEFLRAKFGFNKVFIMTQDVAWARSTASLTMKLYFNRHGWSVVGHRHYHSDRLDFSEELKEAQDKGAQVILCVFDSPNSGNLVKQWHSMNSTVLLSGFISPTVGPSAWETYQKQLSGALFMIFELGNIPSNKVLAAKRFYEAYQTRFGRPIEAGHGPAPAYESVYILAEAIERAGTLDPEAVVEAIRQTDRRGSMGRIRFHRGNQVIFGDNPDEEALGCLIQWTESGHRKIVYPESIAEGSIDWPRVVHRPTDSVPFPE
jgi:branched-chain amino acid transport system substrate-binding protein